jgi:hypothetical protein
MRQLPGQSEAMAAAEIPRQSPLQKLDSQAIATALQNPVQICWLKRRDLTQSDRVSDSQTPTCLSDLTDLSGDHAR